MAPRVALLSVGPTRGMWFSSIDANTIQLSQAQSIAKIRMIASAENMRIGIPNIVCVLMRHHAQRRRVRLNDIQYKGILA